MRLIDKDLILKTATDKEWGLWCEIANIKFAPEVDAIPVEWIRNYVSIWVSEIYKNFVLNMIKTWEKENGKDSE